MNKTAYVVLGMHRSGTSSVAGALSHLGAAPPASLMPAQPDNPSGFWESERISEFNEEIFRSIGMSWLDWGPFERSPFEGHRKEHCVSASRWLLDYEFKNANTIVLKDPRMCRLYPFWRAALLDVGYAPIIVSPVRHPFEVAGSLASRNGITIQAGLRLWLTHVLEAELSSRGDPRHFMLWPDFITNWRSHVSKIASLGGPDLLANVGEQNVTAFLDPSFRRQKADNKLELPAIVATTYGALFKLTHFSDDEEAMALLDKIRLEWADDALLFYEGPAAV